MEPFTFDQAVIAGLLFLLGLLIGMFLFASPKWKRRYKAEHARTRELEREIDRLGRENREFATLRDRAERHPARGAYATTPADRDGDGVPDRRERGPLRDSDGDGTPDIVDRHDGPEVTTGRGWSPVNRDDRRP